MRHRDGGVGEIKIHGRIPDHHPHTRPDAHDPNSQTKMKAFKKVVAWIKDHATAALRCRRRAPPPIRKAADPATGFVWGTGASFHDAAPWPS